MEQEENTEITKSNTYYEQMASIENIDPTIIQVGIATARQKIEDHHSDKFTYALPEWAMLTADPEIIAIVQVHGAEGIQVTMQKVDFKVDFKNESSIIHYATHLQNQMNTRLSLLGYVVFYKSYSVVQQDPYYHSTLTDSESAELTQFNKESTNPDFSFIILTKDLQRVEATSQLIS